LTISLTTLTGWLGAINSSRFGGSKNACCWEYALTQILQ
jgi:hypothetical protein